MSGITGCLALVPGAEPDERWVRAATGRLAHRGPDDEGFRADEHIALGASRLAIIDLSPGGHQPAVSADGRYWMVYDGEIYNYVELAESLLSRGVELRSNSDAEVLLEAYALLGRDVVRKLRGMFAFAIWDTWKRQLFCARDPFGIKPFYYCVDERTVPASPGQPDGGQGGGLVRSPMLRFASERKALAGPGELTALDPDALRRYLAFQYVPPPATMTPPVRVLPPGHGMIVRLGRTANVYRYWRAEMRSAKGPSVETPTMILDVMRDSVAVHLRSDVPVGAFLSGGIDSAAICALAAENFPGLPTFTVGFEQDGYNEIDLAQETAAAIGVKCNPYVISAQEFFTELPRVIWHLDDPLADAAAVPLWFAAREAAKQVKVVLSGEGSDELFGGYAVYHQPSMVRAVKQLPGWGRAPLERAAAMLPPGAKGKGLLERAAIPLDRRYIGNAHVFTGGEADQVLGPGTVTAYEVTDPIYQQAAEAGLDDVSTMQLVDINTWLPGDILAKADRMSMAHGLELRTPFLDREVMTVASRLSREEKTAGGTTKFALREAMGEVLPQAAAERAKLGFPVPIGLWLAGEWFGYADELLRQAQTDRWIDRRGALGLLRRYRAGQPDVTWRQVWALMVFSIWHQIYMEGVYDPVRLGWEVPPG
ncbi:MAG TPA: asparagine synthase (glutamine-hydrolyzing) [Streptosporangiaceae bacterium]|nr:asparagine synthase (glutamine-hydrolyzing) [Streptosporangiaceae bacterium]